MEKNKTIRLITLNAWGGRAMYPLMKFFTKYADRADIFCLQEIRNADQGVTDSRHPDEHLYGPLFDKISRELKEFEGSFAYFDEDRDKMSQAMFWRNDLPVRTIEDLIVYKPLNPVETGSAIFSARKLQYLTLNLNGKSCLISNYHGLWNNGPKTDTPERIRQSESIKKFLDEISGSKMICGDFNLLPDTESMRILEEGMINLIKDYKVKSTRTILYRNYDDPQPNLADYILVSPDIKVKDFKVLPDIASDHSALYLEFEV